MSRPVLIGQVAAGLTLDQYARLEEERQRLAAVHERERQNEARAKMQKAESRRREREAIISLGRGEYLSIRHATWKETLYQRAIRRESWDAFQMRKIAKRWEEREQKKLDVLEFDPSAVVPTFENLPDF